MSLLGISGLTGVRGPMTGDGFPGPRPGAPAAAPSGGDTAGTRVGDAAGAGTAGEPAFGDVLAGAIDRVEEQQGLAGKLGRQLATGEAGDLPQVMLASEQAYLGLATLVQVRNKLLEAYQEFMRMQV